MARRKRRGGRGFRVGKWINFTFKVLGTVIAAGPAIKGVSEHFSDPKNIPRTVLFNYTGIDPEAAGAGMNVSQATAGIASVIGGILLAKLGSFLGRRF